MADATLDPATVAVTVLGGAADSILRVPRRGWVLAVFRRSFYVAFDDDVICVGPQALVFGPLNVLCARTDRLDWETAGAVTNAGVTWSHPMLHVGHRLRFDFAHAATWQPPAAPPFAAAKLRIGMDLLHGSVSRRMPGGLGPLLLPSAGDVRHAARARGASLVHAGDASLLRAGDASLLHAAAPAIAAIRDWLRAALAGRTEALTAIDALIGLGPGLTPSGDDCLCGVMIALRYFGHAAAAGRLAAQVLPSAATGTGLISTAYLRCAAAGQGSGVLFDALEALLAADGALLERSLDAIDNVGHTSGWDCLAGAALVCDEIAASVPQRMDSRP